MLSKRIRVAVVDDQTLVREGVAALLALVEDLEVVGTAADSVEALALMEGRSPHVVLMDVRMPGTNGVAVTRQIVARYPDTRVIILTTFDDDQYLFKALHAGAAGYLLKNADPDHLARAIRAVHAGQSILDPSVTQKVVRRVNRLAADPQAEPIQSERLTQREREVLRWMVAGLTNAGVADRLSLSEGTVRNHVSHILEKLGARDRARAVGLAVEWGLLGEQS